MVSPRTSPGHDELAQLARRHSTATVLYHHAIAERLGLGPSDLKCLDLLLQRGAMTGSQLAALTGLTTGAVTGVVNRLEQGRLVRRRPDPSDGRRQILEAAVERIDEVSTVFEENAPDLGALTRGMSPAQVKAVLLFLARATEQLEQRSARLRADARIAGRSGAASRRRPGPDDEEDSR
jgi:DNA-binding MarR family transcriptional regulator